MHVFVYGSVRTDLSCAGSVQAYTRCSKLVGARSTLMMKSGIERLLVGAQSMTSDNTSDSGYHCSAKLSHCTARMAMRMTHEIQQQHRHAACGGGGSNHIVKPAFLAASESCGRHAVRNFKRGPLGPAFRRERPMPDSPGRPGRPRPGLYMAPAGAPLFFVLPGRSIGGAVWRE